MAQISTVSNDSTPTGVLTLPCVPDGIIDDISWKNAVRRERESTDYIILHTTEGNAIASLARIKNIGAVHYTILENGKIHRTLGEEKVGNHAGVSQWNGDTRIDAHSIGIEIVGCSRTKLTPEQEKSLACLLSDLKQRYQIDDSNILSHSMVASQWSPFAREFIRGRREDAIQFSNLELRQRLGMQLAPEIDPDSQSGAIRFANGALYRDLYNQQDSRQITTNSRRRIVSCPAVYNEKERSSAEAFVNAYSTADSKVVQPLTANVVRGILTAQRSNLSAAELAGRYYDLETTQYLTPDGMVLSGAEAGSELLSRLPRGTKVFVNYRFGGVIQPDQVASSIAGALWDDSATIYVMPGNNIRSGVVLDESSIATGSYIFYRTQAAIK